MTNVEDVTDDDLDDLKANYEDINVKVSAAKTVEVEFTLKGDETEVSNSLEISVIKVDRSWYLDLYTMGNLFRRKIEMKKGLCMFYTGSFLKGAQMERK